MLTAVFSRISANSPNNYPLFFKRAPKNVFLRQLCLIKELFFGAFCIFLSKYVDTVKKVCYHMVVKFDMTRRCFRDDRERRELRRSSFD